MFGSLSSFPGQFSRSGRGQGQSQGQRAGGGGGNMNANEFAPNLLNTSNMVVNDMSSMLTQLAEENKYLSMRP